MAVPLMTYAFETVPVVLADFRYSARACESLSYGY